MFLYLVSEYLSYVGTYYVRHVTS